MSTSEDKPKSSGVDTEKVAHDHVQTAVTAADLSPEHREFLLQRHGTLDLDPIPAPDEADPYNWPVWKVCTCSIPGWTCSMLTHVSRKPSISFSSPSTP